MPPPVAPPGYRPIKWSQLEPNTIVYRYPSADFPTPYCVVDAQTRVLRRISHVDATIITNAHDPQLMVREGPLIVIATYQSHFAGIYTDIPAEIAVLGADDEAPEGRITRPRPLDALPTMHLASLAINPPNQGWPCPYGFWDVVKGVIQEDTFHFELDSQMTVMALAGELIRSGRAFSIKANKATPTYWTFVVTREVLQFIQARCEELTGGVRNVRPD